jgi:hypothetical protein
MRVAKQIVFRYNGDPTTEEIDLDMDGDKSAPEQGSVIDRKGERWKVSKSSWRQAWQSPSRSLFIGFSSPISCDLTASLSKSVDMPERSRSSLTPRCLASATLEIGVDWVSAPPFRLRLFQLNHEALTGRLAAICGRRTHEPRSSTEGAQLLVAHLAESFA